MPGARRFYGWPLVVVGWILYGFGVAPAFYSWGFFLPNTIAELGLSRTQAGLVFGMYTLCGGMAAPLVGVALSRFGLRRTIVAGSLAGALGFFLTSRAGSLAELYLVFCVITGFGHAFATVLPTQTLASVWFLRYRSRVLAVLLTASGVVAPLVLAFDNWLLQQATWRTGWVVIAGVSLVLAGFAAWLVRDSPESMGQLRDGAQSEAELAAAATEGELERDAWTTREAVRTPQFWLMLVCGQGYAVPWYVLTTHSRLHLEDQGIATATVAAALSIMALVSIAGRLTGALGDFISPARLLGIALVIEALGSGLFLIARTEPLAYLAVTCLGVGFGMAYISQASTFAQFFGRRAFATTTGIRFSVGAVFAATTPGLAGYLYDTQQTYAAAFLGLVVLGVVAALVAFSLRAPRRPAAAVLATATP